MKKHLVSLLPVFLTLNLFGCKTPAPIAPAKKETASNEVLEKYLKSHPKIAEWLKVDKKIPALSPKTMGNLSMGQQNPEMARQSLRRSLQKYLTTKNLITIHNRLATIDPKRVPEKLKRTPEQLKTLTPLELDELNGQMIVALSGSPELEPSYTVIGPGHIPYPDLYCESDIGSAGVHDVTPSTDFSARRGERDPKGLWNNFNWPLKPHLTCVKSQAVRGTCSAFATIAALETEVSKRFSMKVNLSEQDAYFNAKCGWNFGCERDKEGAAAVDYLNPDGWTEGEFILESQWPYNDGTGILNHPVPTTDRKDLISELVHFKGVCENYDAALRPFCSETAPQGQVSGNNLARKPVPSSAPRLIVKNSVSLGNGASALALIKNYLRDDHPVIIGIKLTDAFKEATSYVPSKLGAADPLGHAVVVVGFIPNTAIQSAGLTTVPLANAAPGDSTTPGYFIIKNSWSTGYGDGGYVYLSSEYLGTHLTDATVITELEKKGTFPSAPTPGGHCGLGEVYNTRWNTCERVACPLDTRWNEDAKSCEPYACTPPNIMVNIPNNPLRTDDARQCQIINSSVYIDNLVLNGGERIRVQYHNGSGNPCGRPSTLELIASTRGQNNVLAQPIELWRETVETGDIAGSEERQIKFNRVWDLGYFQWLGIRSVDVTVTLKTLCSADNVRTSAKVARTTRSVRADSNRASTPFNLTTTQLIARASFNPQFPALRQSCTQEVHKEVLRLRRAQPGQLTPIRTIKSALCEKNLQKQCDIAAAVYLTEFILDKNMAWSYAMDGDNGCANKGWGHFENCICD